MKSKTADGMNTIDRVYRMVLSGRDGMEQLRVDMTAEDIARLDRALSSVNYAVWQLAEIAKHRAGEGARNGVSLALSFFEEEA